MGKQVIKSVKIPKDKINLLIEELKSNKDVVLISKSKNPYEIFRASIFNSLIIVYSSGSVTYHESELVEKLLLKYEVSKQLKKTKLKAKDEIRLTLTEKQIMCLEQRLSELTLKKEPKSLGQIAEFILDNSNIMLYNNGTVYSPKGHEKYEEIIFECVKENPSFDNFDIMIGQDEVGKGEIFGPMVVGSVALTEEQVVKLQLKGVRDSKSVKEEDITRLAKEIRDISLACYTCYSNMDKFNEKMYEMKNESKTINDFLAWTHSKALEEILGLLSAHINDKKELLLIIDEFDRIKTDQRIENKIKNYNIDVVQTPRAEQRSVAVASASILAKYARNNIINELEKKYNCKLKPQNLPELLYTPFNNKIIKLSFARSAISRGTLLMPTTSISGKEAEAIINEILRKSKLESESIDYKSQLPKNATDFGKLMSAFSNMNGGTIVLGIEDKTKEVIGLDDAQKVEERIQGMIKKLDPKPIIKIIKLITTKNKSLLKVDIYMSMDEFIAYDKKFYIRTGSLTEDKSFNEMKEYWKIYR